MKTEEAEGVSEEAGETGGVWSEREGVSKEGVGTTEEEPLEVPEEGRSLVPEVSPQEQRPREHHTCQKKR